MSRESGTSGLRGVMVLVEVVLEGFSKKGPLEP